MSENIDVLLVQQAQAGHKPSYDELVRRHYRLAWSVAYGIVPETARVEEIVQEAFLKAWRSLASLRQPDNFRSWLVTIARNSAFRCYNELQKERQTQGLSDNTPESITLDEADKDGLRQQLHQAICELPDKYRTPITLRYLEGLSYGQIAEELELTDGSLRGLLNRGMKLLRETVKISG
ncbi:MAG: sigma-70 family RNA polymerase sigma factor [Candidatus Brocadiia bacterium]